MAARAALGAAGEVPRLTSTRCVALADSNLRVCELSHSAVSLHDLLAHFLPPAPPSSTRARASTRNEGDFDRGKYTVPESWEGLDRPDPDPALPLDEPESQSRPDAGVRSRPGAHVHTLRLCFTRLVPSMRAVRLIVERVPRLWGLAVGGCFDAFTGPAAISVLGHGLPDLAALDLSGCTWLTLDVLRAFPWDRPLTSSVPGTSPGPGPSVSRPPFLASLRLLAIGDCPLDQREAFRFLVAARPSLLVVFDRQRFDQLSAALLDEAIADAEEA
ncbi:hypothetical protein HK405_009974 [Cladochytrium tenue]|nr:hypothetical protein HK405_009974 [Cladochytrium tenue]